MGCEEGFIMRNFIVCYLPNIIRVIKCIKLRMVEHVAGIGGIRISFNVLKANPTGKRSQGRSSRRWEVNNRMNLKKKVSIRGLD